MNKMKDFNLFDLNIRKGKYQCVGSGSARRVFDLRNGYVLKVAKNNKGIAQNKAERHISLSDHSNIFAKTTQVSEDFRFLIMEKAVPIRDFSKVRKYFNVKNNRELFRLEEITSVFTNHNLVLNDLFRTVNWGLINNRPVIIDYGFTQSVSRQYYTLFKFRLR